MMTLNLKLTTFRVTLNIGRLVLHSKYLVSIGLLALPLHAQLLPQHHEERSVEIEISTDMDHQIAENEDGAIDIIYTASRPAPEYLEIHTVNTGTATKNIDFVLDPAAVSLPKGAMSTVQRLIPIRDWKVENDETVKLEIGTVLGLGNPAKDSQLIVEIVDDDVDPSNPDVDNDGKPDGAWVGRFSNLYSSVRVWATDSDIGFWVSVWNSGSIESEPTTINIKLADNLELRDPFFQETDTVSSLEPHFGSRYSESFSISRQRLRPNTIYYVDVEAEPLDSESFTWDNDDREGFELDGGRRIRTQCAPFRGNISTGDDPLKNEQWYLQNTGQKSFATGSGTEGEDLHMLNTMATNEKGTGIKVAVVDTGLEVCHPDLHENIDSGASFNFNSGDVRYAERDRVSKTDPFNPGTLGDHGTAIAGIVGATESNAMGIRGIAPGTLLRGFNFLVGQTGSAFFDSLGGSETEPNSTDVDVFNMSFGTSSWGDFDADEYRLFEFGTTELREGKGALFIKSAGNGFRRCSALRHPLMQQIGCIESHADFGNRLPYLITVAALDADGLRAPYSSVGSNLWISAPAGWYGSSKPALVTTDQVGPSRGYHVNRSYGLQPSNRHSDDGNYINTFNGTSGAAAVTSGVVALILGANPNLHWRDVKHILANTARVVSLDLPAVRVAVGQDVYVVRNKWQVNAAGYPFHNWFGFGALHVDQALEMVGSYEPDSLGDLKETDWWEVDGFIYDEVPDSNARGLVYEIPINQQHISETSFESERSAFVESNVEVVHLNLEFARYENLSDLSVTLISPAGTESIVLSPFNSSLSLPQDWGFDLLLSSNAFYGESPAGTWQIKVVDLWENGSVNRIDDVSLKIYYGSHQ